MSIRAAQLKVNFCSGMIEDSSKYLEIAEVSVLLSEHPILCSPKEVCIQGNFSSRPAHTGVIVSDDLFRQTTVHALPVWVGWDRHCLPRLCLSLSNHQFLPMSASPCE